MMKLMINEIYSYFLCRHLNYGSIKERIHVGNADSIKHPRKFVFYLFSFNKNKLKKIFTYSVCHGVCPLLVGSVSQSISSLVFIHLRQQISSLLIQIHQKHPEGQQSTQPKLAWQPMPFEGKKLPASQGISHSNWHNHN